MFRSMAPSVWVQNQAQSFFWHVLAIRVHPDPLPESVYAPDYRLQNTPCTIQTRDPDRDIENQSCLHPLTLFS